jgi:hypothetical protein
VFLLRYFDDDDETADLEYQPAPGSPSFDKKPGDDSGSDDPLDSFMADIEVRHFKSLKVIQEYWSQTEMEVFT